MFMQSSRLSKIIKDGNFSVWMLCGIYVTDMVYSSFLYQGMGYYEASTQFPELFKQLEVVERDIKGGSMAVVALIIKNKLYVANVGKNNEQHATFKLILNLIVNLGTFFHS